MSRYRALVDAGDSAREQVWGAREWRKLSMDQGRLREDETRQVVVSC
jgi:hypothetical protein